MNTYGSSDEHNATPASKASVEAQLATTFSEIMGGGSMLGVVFTLIFGLGAMIKIMNLSIPPISDFWLYKLPPLVYVPLSLVVIWLSFTLLLRKYLFVRKTLKEAPPGYYKSPRLGMYLPPVIISGFISTLSSLMILCLILMI